MRGGGSGKTQGLASELANERSLRIQAEEANRIKDEFLGTLSHELRTPLNAITGWAHTVRRKLRAEPTTPSTPWSTA